MNAYLRQKVAARRRRLIVRKAGCEFCLSSLWPFGEGVLLVISQQSFRNIQRSEARGQDVWGVERQAEHIVQRCLRYVQIGLPSDLLLADAGQMNADG